MTNSNKIIVVIYVILGALLLVGGLAGLFYPSIGLPEVAEASLADELVSDLYGSGEHAMMEAGAGLTTLGLLLLWAARNIEQSSKLDYLFLVFFFLFGGLHWFEYFRGGRTISSPLINSIPLVFFIGVRILRNKKSAN